ncbi:MAG: hypothetical protein ACRDG4_05145 [Chloroflexota bacterium]
MVWRQFVLLLRGRLLRWRLETYGLYMPSLPNARPWWRLNFRALVGLLHHRQAYGRWLREMRSLRGAGATGWWQARLGHHTRHWEAYIEAERRGEAE